MAAPSLPGGRESSVLPLAVACSSMAVNWSGPGDRSSRALLACSIQLPAAGGPCGACVRRVLLLHSCSFCIPRHAAWVHTRQLRATIAARWLAACLPARHVLCLRVQVSIETGHTGQLIQIQLGTFQVPSPVIKHTVIWMYPCPSRNFCWRRLIPRSRT
jgi:hypothetical protein